MGTFWEFLFVKVVFDGLAKPSGVCITARVFKLQLKVINKNDCYLYSV